MTRTDLTKNPPDPIEPLAPRPGPQALQRVTEPYLPRSEPADDDTIDLREYWHILVRRRWTLFAVLALTIVATVLVTFLSTPIYRATLLLQIDREEGRVLEFQNVTAEEARNTTDFYQTQYELLRSRALAQRVVDQLGMQPAATAETASFFGELKRSVRGWIAGAAASEETAAEAGRDPPTSNLAEALLRQLTVAPVRNSRLVRIHYDSPDPIEAAAVANAVAENFINMNLERRFDASAYAKTFLDEQLQQVRASLEDSERHLIQYAREREIVNLDDRLSTLLQQLGEMSSQLTRAQAERIQAEAEYAEILQQGGATSAKVLASGVIDRLKSRRTDLEIEYQEGLKVFQPGYPTMQQLQRQMAEIDQSIERETQAIVGAVQATYQAKIRQEATLTQRLQEIKDEVLALQDRSSDYQTLRREVDTNRELYDGLLQRMKEIGVVAGIGTNNISIVDRAQVPRGAYKPSLTRNLALALAIGLLGGVLLAFLFETLDDTVKTGDDVERRLGAPVLGVFPLAQGLAASGDGGNPALQTFREPQGPLAESARSLRTSLVFSTADGAPKVLHFTSASPGEGKTTAAVNTAIAFAQSGSKVLLIDADLRNPSLHRAFSLANTIGLTNYLAGDIQPADIAQPTEVPRLFTITSGPLPPNPVELLSDAKMLDLLRLGTERFDHVILDSPPVIGLADALVLANLARATVFVVEPGATRKGLLEGAAKRLSTANARMLGALLQKVGRVGSGYGYGYGYGYDYAYHYSYAYGNRSDSPARVADQSQA
ncbi:polysaccharide biosynthesis tyrosine autokinase [Thioalkalicoccus limnaeus]|uniref:non-specific protein-tyrosine kinase n=1 Tax=Thioalkalicoccus limnaeus TaxID=120681 RepID=A0ABV4BAV7_9GAMM